ncbi:hypothetical protein HK439_13245 [Labrenzia aggregata]|uniref:Uncharacterized protein n=2 Tax=Roseibium aggregatum TaxID=187304 RepID=A0A926NTQ5_9HYPH|nr:hypothetical protein [Roseibium aggregatum]
MLALAAGAAYAAGTGQQGYFQIYNKTENHIATGFYTNEGDGWSENWLSEELGPGESARAEFSSDSGECEQLIQIGWLGDDGNEVMDEPISIDICETSNVYLDDNEISYD